MTFAAVHALYALLAVIWLVSFCGSYCFGWQAGRAHQREIQRKP